GEVAGNAPDSLRVQAGASRADAGEGVLGLQRPDLRYGNASSRDDVALPLGDVPDDRSIVVTKLSLRDCLHVPSVAPRSISRSKWQLMCAVGATQLRHGPLLGHAEDGGRARGGQRWCRFCPSAGEPTSELDLIAVGIVFAVVVHHGRGLRRLDGPARE